MESRTCFQVLGIVVHQVLFFVAPAVYYAQTGEGKIAIQVIGSLVLIAIDIYCVISTRISSQAGRVVHSIVVIGYPVVGFKVKEIKFIDKKVVSGFILDCIGLAEAGFQQVAFTYFYLRT